jgi:hypothetical protein
MSRTRRHSPARNTGTAKPRGRTSRRGVRSRRTSRRGVRSRRTSRRGSRSRCSIKKLKSRRRKYLGRRKMSSAKSKKRAGPKKSKPEDVKRLRGPDGQVIVPRQDRKWEDLDEALEEIQESLLLRREQKASGAIYPGWEDLGDDTVEIKRPAVLLSPEVRLGLLARSMNG